MLGSSAAGALPVCDGLILREMEEAAHSSSVAQVSAASSSSSAVEVEPSGKRRRPPSPEDDDEPPPLLSRKVVIVSNPPPPPRASPVLLLEEGCVPKEEDDNAEVYAVSRVMSGRAVWVSCIRGDAAMRVGRGACALEILVAGRRYRVEFSLDEVAECFSRIDLDSDRELECGSCGVRFPSEKHLKQHSIFHESAAPALRESRRIWIKFDPRADFVWRRETRVDPTVVGKWRGASASWELVEKAEDPLLDELNRTKILNLRLRSVLDEDLFSRLSTHAAKNNKTAPDEREATADKISIQKDQRQPWGPGSTVTNTLLN